MLDFETISKIINLKIEKFNLSNRPENLYLPIKYSLNGGGKRIRPVLCLLANEMFDGNINDAIDVAIGIEIFHNFTLLHDDIMDNSDIRRGLATVHKKWNNNIAILSGDAMTIIAYQNIIKAKNNLKEILKVFSKTALEICEGQQYDMDFENRLDVSETEYLEMIKLKTAVLLAASLKIGALTANAEGEYENIYNLGINLGMAFQLQDDYLDSYGNPEKFKKNLGGDIVSNKKTYLLIKALELSSEKTKSELINLLNEKNFIPSEKIKTVKNIYNELELKKLSENLVEKYFFEAENNVNNIKISPKNKENLIKFINYLKNRNY